MKRHIIISCFLFFVLLQRISGQGFSFSQLNTSNGLSDNHILSLTTDKTGFLWIGTPDGLNSYDGYSIAHWYKSAQTGLPSDTIRQLYCDSRNRLWIITLGEIVWADEQRKFHVTKPANSNERIRSFTIFETTSHGIVVFTMQGHYSFNEQTKDLEKIDWLTDLVPVSKLNTIVPFSKDSAIVVYEDKIVFIDYKSQKKLFEKNIANAVTACYFDDKTIAVASRHGKVYLIDIATQQELKVFDVSIETGGKYSSPRISEMIRTPDGNLAIATLLNGLAYIDCKNNKVEFYKHVPIDPTSVSANTMYRVFAGKNGELITGTQTAGVSISNIYNKGTSYKNIFRSNEGEIFDGHVNEMAEDKNGFIWVGASDRLIKWDRKNNSSVFYKYFFNDVTLGPRNLEIRTIYIDKKDRIWIGTIGGGVALFNKQTGSFLPVSKNVSISSPEEDAYINDITGDAEGNIWVGNYGGVYTINPDNYKISVYKDHPVLNSIYDKAILAIHEDAQQKIWFGSRSGIFCFDTKKNKLSSYTTANGLLSNSTSGLTSDQYGNIYGVQVTGFTVISGEGKVKNFSRSNGLRYQRCESVLADANGNAWVSNTKSLVKYSPQTNQIETFEENAGISTDGFRYDAVCRSKDGTMFFGTNRGINFFDPAAVKNHSAQLNVTIYQMLLPDSLIHLGKSNSLKTKYTRNSVQFYFTGIDLTGSKNITYEYKLDGFDKEWQRGVDIHSARYPSLPPGKYKFLLRVSIDKINWIEANNTVALQIIPPLWQRWWFVAAAVIALLAIIIGVVQFRINRVRYTERLKTIYNKKISETEMKALRAQMNPHFIFNSLNSINKYILKSDHTNASRYLTRFAKLIRLILDNSNSKEVSLSDELEALKLYIEMESLRFTNKFSYEIIVDENVSTDTLQVPPLIIQPYVENAIWHGLLHREEGGRLTVTIKKSGANMLQCIIEDNGVGRTKAREMKSKSAITNKSLGMKLTEERIAMLNQYASLNASIKIDDLDENGNASGTKVVLTIPIN